MKGIFITLEGGDCSGKTTASLMIKEELDKLGYKVHMSREPGGVKIAEQIRDVIIDVNNKEMDSMTEAMLYAASRRQHFVEKIEPILNEGGIVICDRFVDSSLVYQGVGRQLGIDKIYELNKLAVGGKEPDLTIFFDIEPEAALKRVSNGERKLDRLDLESIEFHNMVYNGYLDICDKFPNRIVKVNARATKEEVFNEALQLIKSKL